MLRICSLVIHVEMLHVSVTVANLCRKSTWNTPCFLYMLQPKRITFSNRAGRFVLADPVFN